MRIYTGIGSRETPPEIIHQMHVIAHAMAEHNWTLRSGHADGADLAFEEGAKMYNEQAPMEIYLPWRTFNNPPVNDPRYVVSFKLASWDKAHEIAAKLHPAWHRCSAAARDLHARNIYQVIGSNLETPTSLVICWTKDGRREGGTGQALRLAEHLKIPIFDLAITPIEELDEYVTNLMK